MPTFEVHIGEVLEGPLDPIRPGEPTPEVRSVFWRGEAADESGAREAAYGAWDAKYGGTGGRPSQALVKVTAVAE